MCPKLRPGDDGLDGTGSEANLSCIGIGIEGEMGLRAVLLLGVMI